VFEYVVCSKDEKSRLRLITRCVKMSRSSGNRVVSPVLRRFHISFLYYY
jgi:hypothetical protein